MRTSAVVPPADRRTRRSAAAFGQRAQRPCCVSANRLLLAAVIPGTIVTATKHLAGRRALAGGTSPRRGSSCLAGSGFSTFFRRRRCGLPVQCECRYIMLGWSIVAIGPATILVAATRSNPPCENCLGPYGPVARRFRLTDHVLCIRRAWT